MDEVFRKVAAFGLPGVLLVITMAATGLFGAAAITAALATLGGPFGMLGGIGLLGITGLITDALVRYGLDGFLIGVYIERLKKGEPKQKLCKEIGDLPTSGDLKRKLREAIGCIANH
ncbi:MAG: hypothetical protein KME45_10275 [Stenomitos rutilans HA7619-LM2]|jgi:hypothetical protein|nr:hypothetical protein [Stenomitos rutilans HA7619-LM2]